MKTKKIIILFILLIFSFLLFACKKNNQNEENERHNDPPIPPTAPILEIRENYTKGVSLYDNNNIDIDVKVAYNGEIVTNYTVEYSDLQWMNNKATQTITIEYNGEKTHFSHTYLKLIDVTLTKPTKCEPILEIDDIHYGGTRQTNYLVCYDETNLSSTNIYGYEVAINATGQIIEKAVNSYVPDHGMKLSAHGTKRAILESLSIGDYVVFSNVLGKAYVYKEDALSYISYDNCLSKLERIIDKYRSFEDEYRLYSYHSDINLLIMQFNAQDFSGFFRTYYDLYEHIIDNRECTKFYYDSDIYNLSLNIQEPKIDNNAILPYRTIKIDHIGGYRDTNQIVVYYDSKNTNIYGYEFSIDKKGNVKDSAINTDIIKGGYVISGHGDGATLLKDTLKINDYCIFDKDKMVLTVYRNPYYNALNGYYQKINEIIAFYNNELNNKKPIYYKSIKDNLELIAHLYNTLYEDLKDKEIELFALNKLDNRELDTLINQTYYMLIERYAVETHAFWHTPYQLNSDYIDEKTKDGIIRLLETAKSCGFNRVYLNILSHGYAYYKSNYLTYKSDGIEYPGYKDYFDCFIGEAHKLGIEVYVWAITMNFGTSSALHSPNVNETYYTKDFKGNDTHYLDSTNPLTQDFLCEIMKEIASYNPDGIEFDYIRYDTSNILSASKSNVIDYGYTDYAINTFLQENNLKGDIHDLLFSVDRLKEKWVNFKVKGVSDSVNKMYNAIKSVNSDIKVTAAVFSNPKTAKTSVMQDSATWFNSLMVDEIEPMIYHSDLDVFKATVDNFTELINGSDNYQERMNVGIAPMLDDPDINKYVPQILYIQSYGYSYSIFSSAFIFKNNILMKSLENYNDFTLTQNATLDEKINVTLFKSKELLENLYINLLDTEDYNMLKNDLDNNDFVSFVKDISKLKDEKIKIVFESMIKKCH